jgi:hypothetical protein
MPNHPTHIIIKEMTKQILKKLNINYDNFDKIFVNDNVNLGCPMLHSKYDKIYHKFLFDLDTDDSGIKNIIKQIYCKF